MDADAASGFMREYRSDASASTTSLTVAPGTTRRIDLMRSRSKSTPPKARSADTGALSVVRGACNGKVGSSAAPPSSMLPTPRTVWPSVRASSSERLPSLP